MYPADDVPTPRGRASVAKPTRHRASVAPGRVVILLAGRFKGKRAVVLAHLPSGLLLVTGPYAVNGVPLRRVNAAYGIGTSASVDVAGVDVSKFDDAYFRKAEAAKGKAVGDDAAAPAKKVGEHGRGRGWWGGGCG